MTVIKEFNEEHAIDESSSLIEELLFFSIVIQKLFTLIINSYKFEYPMKDQLNKESKNEENESIVSEYRSFEEFKEMSDDRILEIDQFLKSYAELIYDCFSSGLENESGKVIEINKNQNNLKAA